MTTPKQKFEIGDLGGAIETLTGEVKASPADSRRRTFLFELLCFAGEWDRAERQLDVLARESVRTELGVELYRNAIKAERERARVFAEGGRPHFLAEPPAYVGVQLEALDRMVGGATSEARELLDRVEEERPALPCVVNGERHDDLRDADDRLGPVLEIVVGDHYTWLPWEQIKRINVERPARLRDLLWIPTRIESRDGSVGDVFVMALYPESSRSANDEVRLGRMTDWVKVSDELYAGIGLRMLLVGEEDRPMPDVRSMSIDEVVRDGTGCVSDRVDPER
jgi:type VI secretion system protein ImpE